MIEDEKKVPGLMSAAPSAAILRDRRGIRALKTEHGREEPAHGQREKYQRHEYKEEIQNSAERSHSFIFSFKNS